MKTITTQCGECDRTTNQKILFSKKVKEANPYEEDDIEYFEYMVIECAGCGTVSFLRRQPIEDPQENGKIIFIEDHYPQDILNHYPEFNFLRDEDQYELPNALYDLYEEVKNAFESDSNILAGVGLRTLVEAMCLQQKILGKNLQEKIKNLHAAGLISSAELPILDKLRMIGNMSTHEIKAIPLDKLDYALEIVNHVLRSIYILPKVNKKLKL